MKDYRSLEHKIRDLMIEARTGTEIRQKVANVGRPDNNVKDETSKLAKQGEIKTKIIDEEQVDEALGTIANMKKASLSAAEKAGVKIHKGGKVPDNWEENSASKRKATGKSVATSSMDHDKTSKIAEAAVDGKDDGDMGEQDPKKLKGGVTQVDLKPKTNDNTEDENSEDKAGKAAANKANKEIGQKTKPVKEESMNKHFGLPQDLIDLVTETLKGGQKKIDKNHNGKIDGQDFAILRGEKKSVKEAACSKCGMDPCKCTHKEEAEQIDELSRGTLNKYVQKSHNQTTKVDAVGPSSKAGIPSFYKGKNKDLGKDPAQKLKMRAAGQKLAIKKLNKEEVQLSDAEKARLEEIINKIEV